MHIQNVGNVRTRGYASWRMSPIMRFFDEISRIYYIFIYIYIYIYICSVSVSVPVSVFGFVSVSIHVFFCAYIK